MKFPIRNNLLPLVTVLCGFALFLSGCGALPGKQAKQDAATIQKNDMAAQKATVDAKDSNRQITSLDSRIDAKDKVIQQYYHDKGL